MIGLSRQRFDALAHDDECVLYRARREEDGSEAAFASRLRQAAARPDSSEMQSAGCGHDDLSAVASAKVEALAESGSGAPSDLDLAAVSVFGRDEASHSRVLVLAPAVQYPSPEVLKRLEHEYSLREELDREWAVRPLALNRREGPNLSIERIHEIQARLFNSTERRTATCATF
jgi:hypothetical protein